MGGVWERQIRSARAILSSLISTHSRSLDDESLETLLIEAESIVNSRPLTSETLGDATSLQPLSPSNLLTMKSKVILPPPGEFSKDDLYCRKRWRRVQHIANEFWTRWRKEFLTSLQQRQKWTEMRRNFEINDVVLLKTDANRNKWPMAKITDVFPDDMGVVPNVKLMIGNKKDNESRVLERPIQKLV